MLMKLELKEILPNIEHKLEYGKHTLVYSYNTENGYCKATIESHSLVTLLDHFEITCSRIDFRLNKRYAVAEVKEKIIERCYK